MNEINQPPPPPAPRRHWVRWLVVALAVVALVFLLVHVFKPKKAARATPAQAVKVAKATLGDMPETLSELGTVTPSATVTVLPQLSGYLTEGGYKE